MYLTKLMESNCDSTKKEIGVSYQKVVSAAHIKKLDEWGNTEFSMPGLHFSTNLKDIPYIN